MLPKRYAKTNGHYLRVLALHNYFSYHKNAKGTGSKRDTEKGGESGGLREGKE